MERRPSYGTIASSREHHYHLDWPPAGPDPCAPGRFYARARPRSLDLPARLPYAAEPPRARANFLAHIVAHLYIAVRSGDAQGLLLVSARDLAALQEFSDVDLALDTTLFEMADENIASESDSDEDADDDDEDNPIDLVQHRRPPRSAAVVGVRIWTHELLVWLKMKYDMPVFLRAALARVYWALCCCRGQRLALRLYVRAFEALAGKTELLRGRLQLPWRPLARELLCHLPAPDPAHEPLERKELALLLRMAERAHVYFDPHAAPELFDLFALRLSIPTAPVVLSALAMMPMTFGDPDVRRFIAPYFVIWNKLSRSDDVAPHVTARLGTIAMAYLDHLAEKANTQKGDVDVAAAPLPPFGVFSLDQFRFLMNSLVSSLSISSDKYASVKTKFFHGYSSCIVFSCGAAACDPDGIMDQLATLLNAIKSYVHPSNSGEWARPISRLVRSLAYQMHKRFNMERQPDGTLHSLPAQHKLLDRLVARFVSALLPLVRTGLQSKRTSAAEDYLATLNLLCHLNAEVALGGILRDIYESLEGVISTHRVVAALRCMEELTRHFAVTPVFRVHLVRIFTLALPGIDSNDLSKTIHTLNAFSAMANFVPICDLTDGNGDPSLAMELTTQHLDFLHAQEYLNRRNESDQNINGGDHGSSNGASSDIESPIFSVDPALEVQALGSSSSAFKLLIKSFGERIFSLLENIPDPSKSNGIEKDLCDCLPKFLFILIEAMSDDIFKSFRDQVVRFVLDNAIHLVADVIGEICGGIIKRDPKFFMELGPILIDRVYEDIKENGAGRARTGVDIAPLDQNLFWNLMVINECVGNAGEYIVKMQKQLVELSFFLMQNIRGSTIFSSTYLLNQMLQGTTKIRLKETRLISPQYLKEKPMDASCWGGFLSDPYRFSDENLTFEWFIPGEAEVQFAVSTFNRHVSQALSNILGVMKNIVSRKDKDNISLEQSDELRGYLLYLAYGISGISYLLDPSFDEDIPKLSGQGPESIQNRLKLLAQIRDMKSSKFSEKDEPRLENIHENLQQIAENIESKDSIDFNTDSDELVGADLFGYSNPKKNASEDSLEEPAFKRPDLRSLTKCDSPIDTSARASPQLAGVDMSSMNPAITFRERKLYTSRYYFGDDIETRRSNELYIQLHRTRHLVGKSLHYICQFMQTHLKDNTKLFRHLLYVLNIWFADVGRERVLDHSHAKISLAYVSELQKINRVRKPFTRLSLGARIESYHLLRVALHATSRSITDLDKVLLEDIVKLSCSTYIAIANPAQSTLMDAMKRVNGSYNVIIRSSLRLISRAIEENNHKAIESGLSIFELKRIRTRIQSDYLNLQKFIETLHQCFDVDNNDVNDLAQRLFKNLTGGAIAPPSSVCLIDQDLVDSIRPPDEFIDLEIKAVILAKEKKRKLYLEKLSKIEDAVVVHEKHNSHWKTSALNLLFLTDLQSEYEMMNNNDVFQLLTKAASTDHPVISRLALKGITRLLGKLYMLSAVGYDLSNAYDLEFVMKDFVVVDTSPRNGVSYYETWKKEMANLDNPSYFIDNKANSGWLFWGNNMIATTNKPCYDLNLRDSDVAIIRGFSSCVTKEWFTNIVNLWVADNDSNSAFQGTDVFITTGLVMLISAGYIVDFKFQDLLDIISNVYEKNEKSSHIVVCELISGILLGSKYFNPSLIASRDSFLIPFLRGILEKDLTSETKNVWNIFFWWVPAHIDCRRFPAITETLLKFQISKSSDLAINESTRLNYIKSFIASVTWAFPFTDEILQLCFENIDDRHQAIREQIGSLIAIACFSLYEESFASCEDFLEACNREGFLMYKQNKSEAFFCRIPLLFETIETWRKEVQDKTAQEILDSRYIHAATTVLFWLKQTLNTSVSVQYQDLVDTYIVPFLLNLTSLKDVCQLGNIEPLSAFKKVSQIPFDTTNLDRIVIMLEKYSKENLNVVQSFILGEFTETVYFKNLFKLSHDQRLRILKLTNSLMYHKNLEIREAEAVTFSGLVHMSPPTKIEAIVDAYKKQYSNDLDKIRKKYAKIGFKNISTADTITLHGATLGLGALVHAFSFMSPPPIWIPEILAILSNKASGIPGIVGRTAKETLGKFKKTRQDSWHVDREVFNESQMQDLEGVLWKSYFI